MAMDYSHLRTYTPSQCAEKNTGYTYSLSSSYSTAALNFEQENRISPVFDSPRMSRRSLRLHTTGGHYGDDGLLDSSLNHSVTYSSSSANRREARTLKSRRQHQSLLGSQSLLHTPRKSQSGAALQGHSSLHSDASLLSTLLDESCIQERTLVDSFWGLDKDTELLERSMLADCSHGDMNTAQTQTSVLNGYVCRDCTAHERKDAHVVYSSSKSCVAPACHSTSAPACHSTSVSACHSTSVCASSSPVADPASRTSSTIYSRDKSRKHKPAHSSYCGSLNVKDLMAGDGHLSFNGSLWKAAAGAFWWLGTVWYQLVTLMSLLNVFILTRFLPKLYKLLLFLLPFLLLLGLWYWGPSSVLSYLPAVNLTEWRMALHPTQVWSPVPSAPLEQVIEAERGHPATALPPASSQEAASVHAERLSRLEKRLAQLWEGVQSGGRLQERQHSEVLGLYGSLRERLDRQTDRDSMGLWVSGLLDQRLTLLREELQEDTAEGEQSQQQYVAQQQSHASRLAEVETLLQVLAAKTEEVQQREEMATPAPASVAVDSEAHDALLGQVERLEAELGRIRQDLQAVIGCQGRCEQLDGLQDTVSAQVRRELRALFYGSAPAEEGPELPEPLLQWLSARFVSGSDLRSTLASLETSILRDLAPRLGQSREPPCAEAIAPTVAHTAGAAGMSEEHVQLIVKNALRLYSQDRTGLVDYALESGGGSVLSTRCSETYETKTALMSLFSLPLWYFSQSPRVVIQPDVYPGNCWAFKGSQGYLVIRLSLRVRPSAFSLEHIPKSLSPTGNISSALKQFAVYGLDDETQEEGTVLGLYTYLEDGDSLQTFPVLEESDKAYQVIELRVLSNWGHPEYTCLYRFRVHGEPDRK